MGRPKKSEEKVVKPKIKCTGTCGRELTEINFYNTSSPMFPTGKITVCKKCIKEMIDYNKINTIYDILQTMDLPFIYTTWNNCENGKGDTFGNYLRQINSLPQFKNMRWKDSSFSVDSNSKMDNGIIKNEPLLSREERFRLLDKWGLNYSDEELYSFEKKYNLLKNNYPEKTAMHTESLLSYIRFRIKEELATANGDVAEAQKWGQLADKASERAKLNPSQLSKADLSGGLNGFGELVRAVEQAVDIIPILPKFKEKPQDKIDFTLWCYINYVRRLKNLPDAEYEDIWQFYEERRKEYELKSKEDFDE